MKPIVLIFLFTCYICSLNGQSESSTLKNEFGVNVTNVLVRSLGNEAGFEASDYPLSYKRLLSKKGRYLRSGLGFKVKQVDNILSLDEQITKGNIKVGLEWRKQIMPKLLFAYGFDGFVGYEENTVSNSSVELYNNEKKAGGGVFLGLHFLINKHVALEIESTAYALAANRIEETRFLTVGGIDIKDSQNRFESSLNPPQWLYLIIKF